MIREDVITLSYPHYIRTFNLYGVNAMEIKTLDVDIDEVVDAHNLLNEYLSTPWYKFITRRRLLKVLNNKYQPYTKITKQGIDMDATIIPIKDEVSIDTTTGMFVAKIGRKNFKSKMYKSICAQIEKYKTQQREKDLKPEDLIQVISTQGEEGYYDEATGKLYTADNYDKLTLVKGADDLIKWCREEDLELVKGLIEKRQKALEKIEKDKANLNKVEDQLKNKTI